MALSRPPLLFAALTALLTAGCPATGDEVSPEAERFYYPTGLDIAKDESVLFVASSNADLRYDSGSVHVVSLDDVERTIAAWRGEVDDDEEEADALETCEADFPIRSTVVCDERPFILDTSGVKIGNFATELKVQELRDAENTRKPWRLFLAVRGDPSLTWIDVDLGQDDPYKLTCGNEGSFPECDDEHRLIQLRDDEELFLMPEEPFGLFVGGQRELVTDPDTMTTAPTGPPIDGHVVITHLSSGAVSLADAPPTADKHPILVDAVASPFGFDVNTGAQGAVGVAGRFPGEQHDRIYVTSRVDPKVQTFTVSREREFPALVEGDYFLMSRGVQPSTNGRGIAFSQDGSRAFIVNRAPPMLHIIDTSLDEFGVPRNQFIAGVEICSEASNLALAGSGMDTRVYVACFRAGQVWSIDPISASVDAIIEVGAGPHALVAAPGRKRLYVTNNLENTIAVIDIDPAATTRNRVVLRVGRQE